MSKPYLIAITGNFGSGKSLVGNVLAKRGISVIDTDNIVADILSEKNKVTKNIVKLFGDSVSGKTKQSFINKGNLAKIVFNSKKKLKLLESLIHPEVRKRISEYIQKHKNQNIIAVLIPLLFEAKMEKQYHEVWCVICSKVEQYKRLIKKGFTLEEIKKRLNMQMDQNLKAKKADYVIDNSGSVNSTRKQALKRLKLLVQ